MSAAEEKPYPDTWHVITYGNEYWSGNSKRSVKDTDARYYLKESYSYHSISATAGNRYDFNEFEIYNGKFKPVKIEEDSVVVKEFTTEIWDRSGFGTKHIGFTIQDKVGVSRKVWLGYGGVSSFMKCLAIIQQLGNYYSWNEYDLAQKVKEQNRELLKLRIKNRSLESFKEEVEGVKGNVKKLYQKLFETDVNAGIKHLLNSENITDKDLAIAFDTTQKRVREIKKSLKAGD